MAGAARVRKPGGLRRRAQSRSGGVALPDCRCGWHELGVEFGLDRSHSSIFTDEDTRESNRNVAGLKLLDIVSNDVHVGFISERSLDGRFVLLVLRVCDDFLHYIDLPVSLRIKFIKQFVKEDEDKPSTVTASRLARLLFSALSAGGS